MRTTVFHRRQNYLDRVRAVRSKTFTHKFSSPETHTKPQSHQVFFFVFFVSLCEACFFEYLFR